MAEAGTDPSVLQLRITQLEGRLKALEEAILVSGAGVTLRAAGSLSIEVGGNLSISAGGNMEIDSGNTLTIAAGKNCAMSVASAVSAWGSSSWVIGRTSRASGRRVILVVSGTVSSAARRFACAAHRSGADQHAPG